jgi:hypothetical protein
VKYGSGQPYTPSVGAGFNAGLESNSGTKPAFVVVDVRYEKYFKFFGYDMSVFARVFNVLDAKFDNGFVFSDTGSPDYSLNPVGDMIQLANPLRYYQPRRIEIGFTINSL